jgi:single-strand DNA-binding protein
MLNKIHLIGNIGREPEIKTTPSGESVLILSVATSETWRDKQTNEKKEHTEWHRVVTYGKQADSFSGICHKGDLIYVEGKNKTRSYDKDGQKHYSTEVNATLLRKLHGKRDDTSIAPSRSAPSKSADFDDDIPF